MCKDTQRLKVKERGLLGRREERGGQRDGDRSRAMEVSNEKPSTGAEWADYALQVKLYISETNMFLYSFYGALVAWVFYLN